MSLTIFPYSLVRYPGLDYHLLDKWTFINYHKTLIAHASLKNSIAEARETICDKLYELISQQTDDQQRQQLINLKRQVYNSKSVSQDTLELILSDEIAAPLEKYIQWNNELSELTKNGVEEFDRQLTAHRKYLQELASNPVLQNGLLQSSPVLYQQLDDFRSTDPTAFRQKEYRMEFSLLRYLTRIAFKTSPFSTFTYTGLMVMGQGRAKGNDHPVKSSLKLNNTLFNYLISIGHHHPVINGELIIKLNKTATVKNYKIHFLVNYNNVESFQALAATGLQLLILELFSKRQKTITLQELVAELTAHVDGATDEAIKGYLLQLVSTGLLELSINIAGIDPDWDSKLIAYLQQIAIDHPSITLIIDLFTILSDYKLRYAAADTRQRHILLQQAEIKVNTVFHQLQSEAGLPLKAAEVVKLDEGQGFRVNQFTPYKFQAKHIFYEDCATDSIEILPAGEVEGIVSKVDRLLNALRPLDQMDVERGKMRDFFIGHYDTSSTIGLIDFYRDYFLHVKKPEKQLQENGEHKDDQTQSDDWTILLEHKLASLVENSDDEIAIPANFFEDLHMEVIPQQYAKGMFVQFFKRELNGTEKTYGVVNAALPGMGKVSGRFLALFDTQVTRQQVEFNNRLHEPYLKVELNDASSFNANIHPPLLGKELALPGGNNIYPDDRHVHINDVTLRYSAGTDLLDLYYHDQPLYAFDLCLESFYYRSNLYQMLLHFNTEVRPTFKQFIKHIDSCFAKGLPDDDAVLLCLPRIVYDETVIIRRKSWRIKTSIIPVQKPSETNFEFYLRINQWRLDLNLPERLFVFLRRKTNFSNADDKAGLTDDYKPQYISFNQPLLVEVLKKLLQRAGSYIYFEEMLPDPFISNDQTGSRQIKEYLIQWYKY
jgi:hypothetical protein